MIMKRSNRLVLFANINIILFKVLNQKIILGNSLQLAEIVLRMAMMFTAL